MAEHGQPDPTSLEYLFHARQAVDQGPGYAFRRQHESASFHPYALPIQTQRWECSSALHRHA